MLLIVYVHLLKQVITIYSLYHTLKNITHLIFILYPLQKARFEYRALSLHVLCEVINNNCAVQCRAIRLSVRGFLTHLNIIVLLWYGSLVLYVSRTTSPRATLMTQCTYLVHVNPLPEGNYQCALETCISHNDLQQLHDKNIFSYTVLFNIQCIFMSRYYYLAWRRERC